MKSDAHIDRVEEKKWLDENDDDSILIVDLHDEAILDVESINEVIEKTQQVNIFLNLFCEDDEQT